ncbi:unnamed protein product, partial [Bubo scandiacus]
GPERAAVRGAGRRPERGRGRGSPCADTCRAPPGCGAAPPRPRLPPTAPSRASSPRSITAYPALPPRAGALGGGSLGKSSPFSCHMDRLIGWERRRDKGLQQISA